MLLVRTMLGIGDAFAARPTIAALMRKESLVIETPWPEVFADMAGISTRFVKPKNVNIRCANRNIQESELFLEDPVAEPMKRIQLSYHLHPGCESIPEQIAESAGVLEGMEWDSFFMQPTVHTRIKSPLGVFRIPTIRTEYRNVARNPAPGLVAAAVDEIGGDWIHLNDLRFGESLSDPMNENWPKGSVEACGGQFSFPSMLDLVSRARCVVTPVSWMAWAALAYQVPHLIIWGGYAGPETILGPMGNGANITLPDPGCKCFDPSHQCAKSIPVERVREAARCLR